MNLRVRRMLLQPHRRLVSAPNNPSANCRLHVKSVFNAVGSHAIYIPLSSRRRIIYEALCLRLPCESSCSVGAEPSPSPCGLNALRAAVQFSEQIRDSMHRKTGVSMCVDSQILFKWHSLVLAKLVEHISMYV